MSLLDLGICTFAVKSNNPMFAVTWYGTLTVMLPYTLDDELLSHYTYFINNPFHHPLACMYTDYKASDRVVSTIILVLSLTLPVAIVQVSLAFFKTFTHKAPRMLTR